MDSTMTTVNQSNNELNVKPTDDEQIHPRNARSASHGRPPSALGIRSKIPTNINHNRPISLITNTPLVTGTQDDSASPITSGNTTRRLARSHNSAFLKSKVQVAFPGGMQKRWLENQFKKEKKRYLTMRKELDEKQKCAQQMYDEMLQLREKLIADGGKDPGKIEEIKLNFNYSDKQSGDQNICRGSGESGFVINTTIDQEYISTIENELKNYPKDCLNLCGDMLKKFSDIIISLENLGTSNEKCEKNINQHVDNYKKDIEILNDKWENGKKLLDEFNIAIVKKMMTMWTEIGVLRSRIKYLESMNDDVAKEFHVKLNMEMEKFNQLKTGKITADAELIKSKAKIQTLETRVDADEAKITQLQSHIKNLEAQVKQKDIHFEHSTRDLHKSLKHSEETIVSLETQRDNLQSRLDEMRERLEKEKKRRVDKSPRVQEITKRSIEDDIERDKDTKKKVEELETLVETLREEVTCNKQLIVKLQNEKSSSEIKLKEQLAKEQAQSTKLMETYEKLKREHEFMQKRIKTQDGQMLALYCNDYETKNIKKDTDSIEYIQLADVLRQEISDLKRKNKELETQLQQQMKNLKLSNEMIAYLKGAAHSDEKNSEAHQVEKEVDSKTEILQELYSTLETKQMQLTHLENVLKQMEGQEMRNQEQRTRYEKRIAQLEYDAQVKKSKDCRYVMDFSIPHSFSKQNEIEKALESERKYQRLKKESWQMECIYNRLIESTARAKRSREFIRHLRGSCRDREYACHSSVEPKHVDVGCYVHQVVDQCGRELGSGFNNISRQKAKYWNRSPNRMKRKMSSKGEFIGHVRQ